MHVGIADHLGWAIVVASSADHDVVDRRRVELVDEGLSPAPIHYEGKRLGLEEVAVLVAAVRRSVARAAATALDQLARELPAPITDLCLRALPDRFPDDLPTQLRSPHEARADAVMYRRILVELARERGWSVHPYDAKRVEAQAAELLGARADDVLRGPRTRLGPPWTKDHRVALAATIVARHA